MEKKNNKLLAVNENTIFLTDTANIDNYILKTKLFTPKLRNNAVSRRRLIEKLTIRDGHKLTLVSAPAGYGKTTLISEWLENIEFPFSWLSLDTDDNDIYKFFTYLIATLKNIEPSVIQVVQGLFHINLAASIDILINIIINEVIHIQSEFIIVLDDFHVITNNHIHSSIQKLLDYMPPNMHMVILTRVDPPLLLSRLRVRGQLLEINSDALHFSADEIEEFFCKTMELSIDKDMIKILEKKTEGWVAGLQLVGLSLKEMDKVRTKGFIMDFCGNTSSIFEYLIQEVFNQQSHDICLFLYHTSFLDKFTANLCNAVLDIQNSKSILEYLERSNIFLVHLDDKGEWFRYHHLFSEFLQTGLGRLEKELLCVKVARWMEEHGFLSDAVKYSIASRNIDEAEHMIEKAFIETFHKGEFFVLYDWIESLPEERVLMNKVLSAYKAWSYFLIGRPEKVLFCISYIENNNIIEKNSIWAGWLLALKSAVYTTQGNIEALETAELAIELIGDSNKMFQIHALHSLGHSYILAGDISEAINAFKKSIYIAQKVNYHTLYVSSVFFCALSMNRQVKSNDAENLCLNVLEEYNTKSVKMLSLFIIYVPLGILYYERDNLYEAQKYLYDGIKACSQLNILHVSGEGEWYLAKLQYARGDKKAALKTIDEGKKIAKKSKVQRAVILLEAAEVDIYLREGDMNYALNWFEKNEITIEEQIKPFLENYYFTYVRLLIMQEQFDKADILLGKLQVSAEYGNRYTSLITIHTLRAIIYKSTNCTKQAAKELERAVIIGAKEGYYRRFLDESCDIIDILPMVRGTASEFVDELKEKLKKSYILHKLASKDTLTSTARLLSIREIEVLKLIELGYSNDSISKTLFITLGTTKNHLTNIYSKLEVKNRTQAVAKSRELGII